MGTKIEKLSDSELLAALDELAAWHHRLVAKMVAHLAEVERRQLHLALGYSSLYVYATERLGLSEHEAYLRIRAARVALQHDGVLSGLESGELSLSTVKAVAPHLDAHPELLAEAAGKSRRQVERLVAETVGVDSARNQLELRQRAIAGGRVELSCVVSVETAELLEQVLDLMMHSNPARDFEAPLSRAFGLLKQQLEKRSRGGVPAQAQRALSERSPMRCSFVGEGGRRCDERRFIHMDHDVPKAAGGSNKPENLRWLCQPHNEYEAARKLGPQRVRRQRLRAKLERDTQSALTTLGFKKPEAKAAARLAIEDAKVNELEPVLRAALASLQPSTVLATEPGLLPR